MKTSKGGGRNSLWDDVACRRRNFEFRHRDQSALQIVHFLFTTITTVAYRTGNATSRSLQVHCDPDTGAQVIPGLMKMQYGYNILIDS